MCPDSRALNSPCSGAMLQNLWCCGCSGQHSEVSGTAVHLVLNTSTLLHDSSEFSFFLFSGLFSKNFFLPLYHLSPSQFSLLWTPFPLLSCCLLLPFCSLTMVVSILLFITIASWNNLSGQEKMDHITEGLPFLSTSSWLK